MIAVENLSIRSGRFALDAISFALDAGEYGVLMGRTGSGKTTLLETLCGLKPALAGSISLQGRDVTRLGPAQRAIGYVPQDLALFAPLTVREHLAFAPTARRWDRDRIKRRVGELAELLALGPLLERKPPGLSGGEAQRVALGRALACEPGVLLLDEPLSALDEQTRAEVQALLQQVQQTTGVTTLHVTHSGAEAKRLASRILVLHDGRLHEDGLGGGP